MSADAAPVYDFDKLLPPYHPPHISEWHQLHPAVRLTGYAVLRSESMVRQIYIQEGFSGEKLLYGVSEITDEDWVMRWSDIRLISLSFLTDHSLPGLDWQTSGVGDGAFLLKNPIRIAGIGRVILGFIFNLDSLEPYRIT